MKLETELFKKIDSFVAVTRSKGVYRQVDVYARGGFMYIAHRGGFLRVFGDGKTTRPDVLVDGLNLPPGYKVEDAKFQGVRIEETYRG